jgi:hypothetical protein
VWKVGDGRKIRIGEDPWEGSDGSYKLSKELVEKLNK